MKTSIFIGGFPAMFDDQSEATPPFWMSFSRLAASSTDTVSGLAMRLRRACGDDAWDVEEELGISPWTLKSSIPGGW